MVHRCVFSEGRENQTFSIDEPARRGDGGVGGGGGGRRGVEEKKKQGSWLDMRVIVSFTPSRPFRLYQGETRPKATKTILIHTQPSYLVPSILLLCKITLNDNRCCHR